MKLKVIIEGNIKNKSNSTTRVDQKAQNYLRIRSITKAIIEESTEFKTFSSLSEDLKTVYEPNPSPKNTSF